MNVHAVRPDLSVVICSLNGAAGIRRCLRALAEQSIRDRIEIIVVDDGSRDSTTDIARAEGAIVISHPHNRGLSAARNTGLMAASADIVAYVDDDCEPEPSWAVQLLSGYADDVVGVGGEVISVTPAGYLSGFLERHPFSPLEIELSQGTSLPYRLFLYVKRQLQPEPKSGRRDVYALIGANMSFRRKTLLDVRQFDERFTFGADEVDLCMRIGREIPEGRLVFVPESRIAHHFRPELRDTLRRSRAYGVGAGRMYRKWPSALPAIFPGPLLVLLLLALAVWAPVLLVAAVLTPLVVYPDGLRAAAVARKWTPLLDGYLQLTRETMTSVGFLQGYWRYRNMAVYQAAEPLLQHEVLEPFPQE